MMNYILSSGLHNSTLASGYRESRLCSPSDAAESSKDEVDMSINEDSDMVYHEEIDNSKDPLNSVTSDSFPKRCSHSGDGPHPPSCDSHIMPLFRDSEVEDDTPLLHRTHDSVWKSYAARNLRSMSDGSYIDSGDLGGSFVSETPSPCTNQNEASHDSQSNHQVSHVCDSQHAGNKETRKSAAVYKSSFPKRKEPYKVN